MSADDTAGLLHVESGRFEQVPHWLLFHRDVPERAIVLYLVLRSYPSSSGTYPGHRSIAERLSWSRRKVQETMTHLVRVGAVVVRERYHATGGQTSNLYIIRWEAPAQESAHPPMQNPAHPPMQESAQGPSRNLRTKNETVSNDTSPTDVGEPARDDASLFVVKSERRSGKTARIVAESFAAFWEVYPRRAARAAAERAYAAALKRGADPNVIIHGAQRYRDDPNRDDAFTAHAATWLNQGRWDDDPLPARAPRDARERRELAAAERMREAAAWAAGDDEQRQIGGR